MKHNQHVKYANTRGSGACSPCSDIEFGDIQGLTLGQGLLAPLNFSNFSELFQIH